MRATPARPQPRWRPSRLLRTIDGPYYGSHFGDGFLCYHVNRKVSCSALVSFLENIHGMVYAAILQAPANSRSHLNASFASVHSRAVPGHAYSSPTTRQIGRASCRERG